MNGHHPQPVEDFTTITLVFLFINMVWIFGVIWAQFGLVPVILIGWFLNRRITRLEEIRIAQKERFARFDPGR